MLATFLGVLQVNHLVVKELINVWRSEIIASLEQQSGQQQVPETEGVQWTARTEFVNIRTCWNRHTSSTIINIIWTLIPLIPSTLFPDLLIPILFSSNHMIFLYMWCKCDTCYNFAISQQSVRMLCKGSEWPRGWPARWSCPGTSRRETMSSAMW